MTSFTGFVVYALIWWTVLFAVLPIGVRPEADADPAAGGWRGAPSRPLLLRKMVATTLLSAVLWAAVFWLVRSDWLSFRSGWFAMPE